MRRNIVIVMIAVMMFAFSLTSPSYASVGVRVGGANPTNGTATDFSFKGLGGALSNDGSLWTFNLMLAGVGSSGATSMTTSDLAVPIAFNFIRKAIADDSAFTAGTLADGKPGQMVTVYITEDRGSEVFVITPDTSTSFSTASFDSVADQATFLWADDTNGWSVWSKDSVTITVP